MDHFKHEANVNFTKGERGYDNALNFYLDAIENAKKAEQTPDVIENTGLLYANLAQLQLKRGNYRYAYENCMESLKYKVIQK